MGMGGVNAKPRRKESVDFLSESIPLRGKFVGEVVGLGAIARHGAVLSPSKLT
jgi:hypothetical protein